MRPELRSRETGEALAHYDEGDAAARAVATIASKDKLSSGSAVYLRPKRFDTNASCLSSVPYTYLLAWEATRSLTCAIASRLSQTVRMRAERGQGALGARECVAGG
jgi:hypothetical protein